MKLSMIVYLFCFSVVVQSTYCFAQRTQPLQHLWEVQPDLGDIWAKEAENPILSFDIELLDSKELQEVIRTSQLICQNCKSKGWTPQLRERAQALLIARLKNGELPLQTFRSMVSALVLIGDDSHANFLWEVTQQDPLARGKVERALAAWKSSIALAAWRKRLSNANDRPDEIAIALEGIAAVGSSEDSKLLEQVLRGHATTFANRMIAAKVIGQLNVAGYEALAKTVLESDVEQRHLLASLLIRQHTSDLTSEHMRTIFAQGPAVAQRIAASSICTHFPELALELISEFLQHEDSEVRLSGLAFLQTQPNDQSLRLQATLFEDRNKAVRRTVGDLLVARANRGQRAIVDECITKYLHGEAWQGIVQSIEIAVRLEDGSRCSRLVELLDHKRPEVNMYAGWALMMLAEEPEILKDIFTYVDKATEAMLAGSGAEYRETDHIRLSYLIEALGRTRYEPATSMLKKYVPKREFKLGIITRASAIWALGELFDGKDNPSLRSELWDRMNDMSPIMPEDYLVRFSCALALGEMGYEDSVPTLKQYDDGMTSELGHASDWALREIEKSSRKQQ